MKNFGNAILAVALAMAAGAGAQGAGWTRTMKVVMNTTATGANVAGEVKGFPVPVHLTAGHFDFSQAKPDGADLRVTDAAGAALPFEIEHWDAAAKQAAVWVRTDVKGSDAAQSFTLHYGNAGASAAGDGRKVFAREEGWTGVWHLSEAGSAAAGNYKDATANAGHGTGLGITGGATGEGRVGRAVNLDVAARQYIRIDDNAVYNLRTAATYSIWANPRSHNISYQAIFTKGETGFRIHFYGMPSWPDNTDPDTKAQKNITEPCIEMSGGGDFCPLEGVERPGLPQGTAWKGEDIRNGTWHHLLVVLAENKDVSYYVDGRHRITWKAGGTIVSGTEPVAIGNNANRARQFDGLLDEARILSVAKNADWAKLDYESQKAGSRFLEFMNGPVSLRRPAPSLGTAGLALRRYDLDGRQVAEVRTTGDARFDAAALARLSRPGLHVDRITGPEGAVAVRMSVVP